MRLPIQIKPVQLFLASKNSSLYRKDVSWREKDRLRSTCFERGWCTGRSESFFLLSYRINQTPGAGCIKLLITF